ncbi:hypothetical protein [uncultured Alistipes sp.]|uniref:hypothetical protein n=1 Tax=uncultured Alistipes sp. TaxID=538949 RepID=UPI002675B3DA|nr:hypothetical protein [uncultured Alistipes sp.]
MGTEVKLKPEAIKQRIAELEGKMTAIQASKERAEARATIRRLKAQLKTDPRSRSYKVKTKFVFEGTFEVKASSRQMAIQIVESQCGMNMGQIHTCCADVTDWDFGCNPTQIVKR